MPAFSLVEAINKLVHTVSGQEASMYGPIRDIFINTLGYSASDVDIDIEGENGRPDVTVSLSSGQARADGRPLQKIPWIVVEAKDEHECFVDLGRRERIFDLKSKYIGPDTAWFVMIEPTLWVMRPISEGIWSSSADVEVPLNLPESEFRRLVHAMHADRAGLQPILQRFRDGDMSLIAVDRLSPLPGESSPRQISRTRLNRKRFFQEVRNTTSHLQGATLSAVQRITPEIHRYRETAEEFWREFEKRGDGFDPHTLSLLGNARSAPLVRQQDRKVARLRHEFAKNPSVVRLALHGFPAFQQRTGAPDNQVSELLAVETANLIVARVLLLRFLEDQGFFGAMHYVCNGGIAAFQGMHQYFHASYTDLLASAYREGSRLYASAFDETELDWVFGLQDGFLSEAIEWAMFRFARYDFKSIKGDVLNGIYDRFMDPKQRKRFGEFYTPPSIARYIIERIDISRDSRILDPACGSGTFLIESYRAMVGQDADRGIVEYSEVLAALKHIGGNDLNTFSGVLAQIQLLWQVLGFQRDIEQQGFPEIVVTTKANALVERNLWNPAEPFAELDVPEYDAVIGNPPYIRAERSAQDLDQRSREYFERGGISSRANTYTLFLYRALDRWCKRLDPQTGRAGRVGFVVPLSLFDSEDAAALRRLFSPGGRWTIREIVDMEVIWRDVFDAKVLPAVIIAENRPPTVEDVVSIRFADSSCVNRLDTDAAVPDFSLSSLPESFIAYADLFSQDGRILTRLTPERLTVLRKLWANSTMWDAAKPYWIIRARRIHEYRDTPPDDLGLWEERRFCTRGLVFRHKREQSADGMDVYKGENIVAASLEGDPVITQADIDHASDPGPWRFRKILPHYGYAIAQVAHCPNAVAFNPQRIAFTDTATVFIPREDLRSVPFDLLLLSNIYVWFYALAARRGVLDTFRSHVYPTNFAVLPWNDELAAAGSAIEAMRNDLITACRDVQSAEAAILSRLRDLNFPSLKQRIRKNPNARLIWSEMFEDPEYHVSIAVRNPADTDDGVQVWIAQDLLSWILCSDREIAHGLFVALKQYEGADFKKSDILNLSIPVTTTEIAQWDAVITHYQVENLTQSMHQNLDRLDRIVGTALGLTADDIRFIQDDLMTDAFLRNIRPRYPGTTTRRQEFRTGLDLGTRYS